MYTCISREAHILLSPLKLLSYSINFFNDSLMYILPVIVLESDHLDFFLFYSNCINQKLRVPDNLFCMTVEQEL